MTRALVLLGAVALVAAATLAWQARSPQDVGTDVAATQPPVAVPRLEDDSSRPAATPTSGPRPSPLRADVTTSSARLSDRSTDAGPVPARLALPRLGVDAEVVAVGVDPDGQMSVPEDVAEVGWYRHGPVPGVEGSAVLAGHVDSRTQGLGVFAELTRLAVGDEVVVTDVAGEATSWVVTGRQTLDKATLPVDDLYRRDGPPRLVLITCGGGFDADRGSYRSNVVVVAELQP